MLKLGVSTGHGAGTKLLGGGTLLEKGGNCKALNVKRCPYISL